MKFIKKFENYIELKPSDFANVNPMNCRFNSDRSEHETIAKNIMIILWRTGNEFRDLSWKEYKEERLKDGNFTEGEKYYFDNVIRWCFSANNAKQFSPKWQVIKPEIEINSDKYNL